ncbi:MAG: response regulator, partial [Anaerolineae bacterium]|nr:response regulator [Anaerolineae bacterium]
MEVSALKPHELNTTVLVVDDDPLTLEMMSDLLSDAGYMVQTARDGFEALEQVIANPPDVVLLDVMMPGMDGLTVCQQLRQDSHTRELPIVLVTALSDRQSRLAGLEAGADDFLTKPVDPAEIVARVGTIARLNRYRKLQRERAKFEWLVQSINAGVLLLTEEGDITYINPQARLWLGLDEGSDDPIPFMEAAAIHFQWRPETTWQDLTTSDFAPRFLVRPLSQAVPELWLRVEGERLPTPAPGDPSVWMVRLTDVTAEQVSWREANTFFDILSHKLRTPITLALGSLEFIMETPEEEREALIRETAPILLKGITQLYHELEKALLFIGVVEEPKTDPPLSAADLDAVIRQLLADDKVRAARHNTNLPHPLPPPEP